MHFFGVLDMIIMLLLVFYVRNVGVFSDYKNWKFTLWFNEKGLWEIKKIGSLFFGLMKRDFGKLKTENN